jgi:DnaK suppressor protein
VSDPKEYRPHAGEEFMSSRQLAWFEARLIEWRDDILRTSGHTLEELGRTSLRDPDMADRAASESDWATELRTRDRQRKLLSKISQALARIRDGEYGYCEVTGDPIAIERLIARPTASMTVIAQEAHERRERISRAA